MGEPARVLDGFADFDAVLGRHGLSPLRRDRVRTLQVNVGKLCNQACHHCHVEAGPKRTEIMRRRTAERIVALLASSPGVGTVDLTGGAPELNPHFRYLVESARGFGRYVIDRCNLTVFFEPDMEWLPRFLAANQVEVICSLPCYSAETVDRQRGRGVFEKSIAALRWLNALGYARPGLGLRLNLVYNPLGAFLPPPQEDLEAEYKRNLREHFGVRFDRLLTISNMPVGRFAADLMRAGKYDAYMSLLVNHFNRGTAPAVMCRSLVSVSWDGTLYDCDFNQMLACSLRKNGRKTTTIWDIERLDELDGAEIRTGSHCFGCTAGAGSSCTGALR